MKKYSFKGIMAVLAGAVVAMAFAVQVSAIAPNLSFTSNGNGTVSVTVYADPNASVILDYYSGGQLMGAGIIGYTNSTGSYTNTLNTSGYNIPTGAQVVVMVNGQQSLPVIWPTTNGYYNPTYPNNGSTVTPTLSQSSINLTVGQTQSVTISNAYYYNGYNGTSQYALSNPASNIVSATINGSTITLYGQASGTGAISVCANGTNTSYYGNSNCANLYVTVSGSTYYNNNPPVYYPSTTYYPPTNYYPTTPTYYPPTNYYNNTPLTVSNSNVQVTVGNSASVIIYGNNSYAYPVTTNNYPYNNGSYNSGSNYYVSNNNNGIATATISGNNLTIYGTNAGNMTVNVCDSTSGQCAPVNVTVIAPNYYTNYNGQYQSSQNGQWYYSNNQHCWMHR